MSARRYYTLVSSLFVTAVFAAAPVGAQDGAPEPGPLSDESEECIGCHEEYMPGLVADWAAGRHAAVTPEAALAEPPLQRRVSSEAIPEELRSVVVGCYECHSLNASAHQDTFSHFGYEINVVVSPNDCKVCHAVEVEQYSHSKKAHALDILEKNATFAALVETLTSVKHFDGVTLKADAATDAAKAISCYGCHGTRVTVKGTKTVEVKDLGDVEVPDLANWPSQGVGRANPDGSLGACTACHARHRFSIAVARQPFTCVQCHLEPDVPAWDVYRESKHGNLFLSDPQAGELDAIPWRVGADLRVPTCATCHNSLLVTPEEDEIAARTHDFGARLWVRLFGLPYAHAQPKSGKTYTIKNKDGLQLPTAFTGEPASEYLIDEAEQQRRRALMTGVCRSCHASSWVAGHFARLDRTVDETNQMTLTATRLMQEAWSRKLADATNPFDESLEHKWVKHWLYYANSTRYGAAMSGPDYSAFKNGWASLTMNLREMYEKMKHAPKSAEGSR
jgi:hypothetical protein